VLLAGGAAWAQDTALTGTVADPTGAVVPGAEVTATNQATGAVRTVTTGEDGKYVFTQMTPGMYRVQVKSSGFKTSQAADVTVPISLTTRFDITLQVGEVTETITVESETSRINTTDATLGNPFSGDKVLNLPSLSLDPAGLLSLQAGVTFVPGQSDVAGGYSGTTDADGRGGSVNGSRSDQTNITLDGVDVNDAQNGFAFTSVLRATQASLQEFRVTTTNYNADQGRSSAGQVQLVTKSGSNEVHGAAYWTHRNEFFNANDFFLNRTGTNLVLDDPTADPSFFKRPKFRRHQYGIALGGPIVRDRFFLFGNWEELREIVNATTERAVPSAAFRDGVLIYRCASAAACPGGPVLGVANTHNIPAGHYGLTPAELAAIDPLGIGPNLAALAHFQQYPLPNSTGTFDAVNVRGFTFPAASDNFFRTYILRADLNVDRNANHTLYWRGTMHDDDFVAAVQQFPGDPANQTRVNGNRGYAVGYRAVLSPNAVNTFRYGYTRIGEQTVGNQTSDFIAFRFFDNLEDYGSNTFNRVLPQHHIRNDVSWNKGRHTMSFGGELRTTRNSTESNAASFHFFSHNPSWLPNVGRNVQPFSSSCGQPGCTAVPAVSSGFAASYRDSVINLLGVISQATAQYNFDRTGATLPVGATVPRRFGVNEYELYFQDQWRLHPDLTITAGVRYMIVSPPWETNGNQVNPTLFDQASGQTVPGGLNQWFEIRRQLMLQGIGTDNAPQVRFELGGPKNNGPHYYDYDYNNFSPRIAAAYTPRFREGILGTLIGDGKTVLRAGYSVVYDRVGQGLAASFDTAGSFGMSTGIDSLFGGCDEGANNAPLGVCPRFTGVLDTAGAVAQLPGWLAPSPGGSFPAVPPGQDGFGNPTLGSFAITSALDNGITTPYSHTINFSIARSLPWNLTVEGSYVGRRGRNLLMVRDLAMPADICDPASGGCYFEQARALLSMADSGPFIAGLQPIPFWENLFPSFGPSGAWQTFVGGLPCDVEGIGGTGPFSATQVAADWLLCSHPDTTVFPWAVDGAGGFGFFPGTVVGAPTDPDLDGDGIPDSPFAFFDDQFATLTAWSSIARSEYHAFQLVVRKQTSHGLTFDINYTLSKSLDHGSSVERAGVAAGFSGTGGYTGSTINSWEPDLEYSLSDFDMRHQFNANWVYELPLGRGRAIGSEMTGFWNALFGGWQISGIVRVNSGLPANVINARVWPTNWNLQGNATCGDRSTNGNVAPCPSTQNFRAATHSGVVDQQGNLVSGPNLFRDPDAAFGGFRFTLPGQRGERNIIRGDKYINLDLGLAKAFSMPWEGHSIRMRWDVFNVFNGVYFDTASVTANIGSQGSFGNYSAILGGPRRMQIALRYEF
jgi:hypothetical protein